MDKGYRKMILDLIRSDFITMNGSKNNIRMSLVLVTALCGGLGFMFSPLVGLYVPLIISSFFVPMIFQNEMKYHCERLYSLLPIERKDLVRSRYIMSAVLYIVFSMLFYLLMLLSMKLKLYYFTYGDAAEQLDIIKILAEKTGGMTELGMFNLIYFAAFSVGLMTLASNLKKYFMDSQYFEMLFSGEMKKSNKKENIRLLLILGIIAAVIFLLAMIVSGYIPLGAASAVIIQLFAALASAANGFPISAVLLTVAVMTVIYKYVCTVLEYDEKEL